MAGRIIAQLVLAGVQVFGRAFMEAYRQAVANAARGGGGAAAGGAAGAAGAAASGRGLMSLEEAAKILNVEKGAPSVDVVRKNFEHLFKANDPNVGGSFYLQSKVVRAKERFEQELKVEIPIADAPAGAGGPPPPPSSSSSSSAASQQP